MERARGLACTELAALVAACGTSAPVEPDAAMASLAWSVELPPVELPPGVERTLCFYTTMHVAPGTVLAGWESDVSSSAHGLQVLATEQPLAPDGTLTDACVFGTRDQVPRLLYHTNLGRFAADMPVGAGMAVPATQPVVIRLHMINSTEEPRAAAVQVRAIARPMGAPLAPVATFVSHRTDLRIAAASSTETTGACTLPPGTELVRLTTFTLGHATSTEVRDDSGVLMRSVGSLHAPEVAWASRPHPIRGALAYACRYTNTGAAEIVTGGVEGRDELCMMMAQVTPATAPVVCIDDTVVP